MAKRKKAKPPTSDQSKLFIEKAREIGCNEGADDEVMRRLVRQSPKAANKKAPTKRGR